MKAVAKVIRFFGLDSERGPNPWLFFAPFLVLYLGVIRFWPKTGIGGDAERYLMYAENLLAGGFAPPGTSYLWSGPGYSLFLAPFVALDLPVEVMIYTNAFLLYVAHVLVYKSVRHFTDGRMAMGIGALWAAHYSVYESLPLVMTEVFTLFLVSAIIYLFTRWSARRAESQPSAWYFIALSIAIGWLILTKVLFGYVFLLALGLAGLAYLYNRTRVALLTGLAIALGLAIQSPYLGYTYQLTGKTLYWSNAGGSSLYWMSSPYPNEYGNWEKLGREYFEGRNVEAINQNHREDIERLFETRDNGYPGVRTDSLFRALALQNIRTYPLHFVKNCVANTSRLFFGFPNSMQYENLKFLKFLPNLFFLPLILFCLLLGALNFRAISFPVGAILVWGLLYLGLSIPLSAYPRMFLVIAPAFVLFIAYILHKTVRVRLFFSP